MNTQNGVDVKNEPLAYRYWPIESATNYYEYDLDNEEKVKMIFDYAQILEVIIYKVGWNYLIKRYGFDKLFEINKKSDWFDCEGLEEFKLCIEDYVRSDT